VSQTRKRHSARQLLKGWATRRRRGVIKEEDMVLRAIVNVESFVRSIVRKDEGQDLLEYALLVALIALGAVIAVTAAGDKVEAVFDAIAKAIPGAPGA
jgi:Flp pilus assembly pilin Flp